MVNLQALDRVRAIKDLLSWFVKENLPFDLRFSLLILRIFTSMSCVQRIRVREMEKIFKHAEARGVKAINDSAVRVKTFERKFYHFRIIFFPLSWKITMTLWLLKIFCSGALVNFSSPACSFVCYLLKH